MYERREWLATECTPCTPSRVDVDIDPLRPRVFPLGVQVSVGGRVLHPSHSLEEYRGLIICTKCGHRASVRPKDLVNACMPGPTLRAGGSLASIRCRRLFLWKTLGHASPTCRALERALRGAAELRARGAQAGEARQHVQRGAVVRPPRRAGGLGRQEEVARGVRQPPVGRTTLDTTRCHVNCQVKLSGRRSICIYTNRTK